MSKRHGNKHLFGQRALLAVSLSASIAAFGCTSDRHLGNGDPVVTPGLRTTPTSSPTTGSETGSSLPPMYSSYSRTTDMSIRNGAPIASSEAGVATTMAELQPDVRYLGQTTGGTLPAGTFSTSQVTGQFQNPALATNPQLTINSSVSSQPVPAISSGAGGGGTGGGVTGGASIGGSAVTGALVTGGTGSGLSAGGNVTNIAAPLVVGSPVLSPTAAAVGLPSAAFSTQTLSPTAASVLTAPPSASATRAVGALAAARMNRLGGATSTTARQTVSPTNATPVTTATTTLRRGSATAAGDIRIVTTANGRTTITNTGNND